MSKTNYTDPTNATAPPGGKHHETSTEGQKRPVERPDAKAEHKRKKAVSGKTASKTER